MDSYETKTPIFFTLVSILAFICLEVLSFNFFSYFTEIKQLILGGKKVVSTLNTKFQGGIIQQLVTQDTIMAVLHVTRNNKMGTHFYVPTIRTVNIKKYF
jgi:hypothetical protein